MENCDYCDIILRKDVYMWNGLTPKCCSTDCAARGCPNALLIKGELNDT